MVVRLGIERSIEVYSALQVSAVAVIVGGFVLGLLPVTAMVAIAAIVPAMSAIAVLRRSRGLFPDVVPAQGLTIVTHLAGGLLLCAGLVVGA
jgi:1,4-dihydroxy-2-naphthoate octaprenyltransferase